jgi:tetratricopeptide (TPR) repeat protein
MSVTAHVDPLVEAARKKVAAGEVADAHLLYEELLDKNPGEHLALSENGLLYLSSNNYESAMMYLESARAIEDDGKLQLAAAECFLRLGLTEDAVDVLTLLLDAQPLLVPARLLMAMTLSSLNEASEALVHSEIVLKLEPSNAVAQRTKAVSMCQMGLYKDSLALFEQSLALQPNRDTFVAFQFAEALYKYDQLEDCITQLNSLLEVDKSHVEALMLKANALEDLNRLEEADSVMEQVSLITGHTLDFGHDSMP